MSYLFGVFRLRHGDARPSAVRRPLGVAPASVAAAMLALAAGCSESGRLPVAPEPNSTPLVRPEPGEAAKTGAGAGARALPTALGECLTGARTPDGQYRTKVITIPLLAGAASASDRVIRVGFRGWSAAAPEPVRLAVCNIPDVPAVRELFARRFGGSVMSFAQLQTAARNMGVPGAEKWTPQDAPARTHPARSTFVVDAILSDAKAFGGIHKTSAPKISATAGESTMSLAFEDDPYCDPYAIIPEPGCETSGETDPAPSDPPPPDSQDGTLSPDNSVNFNVAPAETSWLCNIYTWPVLDYGWGITSRHRMDCFGAVSVFSFFGEIQREKTFLWFFRTWHTVGSSPLITNYGPGSRETNTDADCEYRTGWYRSRTHYSATPVSGSTKSGRSTHFIHTFIQCW